MLFSLLLINILQNTLKSLTFVLLLLYSCSKQWENTHLIHDFDMISLPGAKNNNKKKNWLCFNSIHVQIRRLYFSNPGSFCHPSKAAAQAALDMNSKKYTPPSQGQCVCVWIQTFAKKRIMFPWFSQNLSHLCAQAANQQVKKKPVSGKDLF